VATPGVLLPHVPPGVASLRVIVDPMHTAVAPAMPDGSALTVMGLVTVHPAPNE